MSLDAPLHPARSGRPVMAAAVKTIDFKPLPVRPRADGWTPGRQRHFLEVLAATRSVTGAARSVGLTPMSCYRLRHRADARDFAAAWDEALRFERLPVPLCARRWRKE